MVTFKMTRRIGIGIILPACTACVLYADTMPPYEVVVLTRPADGQPPALVTVDMDSGMQTTMPIEGFSPNAVTTASMGRSTRSTPMKAGGGLLSVDWPSIRMRGRSHHSLITDSSLHST